MAKDAETRQKEYKKRRDQVKILKIGIAAGLVVFVIFLFFWVSAVNSGYCIDPTGFISVHYTGYDGMASAQLQVDKAALINELDKAYAKYSTSLWPIVKTHTMEDFEALGGDFAGELSKTSELKNGDEINISISMNQVMCDALKVSLKYSDIPLTVADLQEGIVLSRDDIFKDVTISQNGISPEITLEVTNNSEDDFLKTLEYKVRSDKEFFEKGDRVVIEADYDRDLAVNCHYAIDDASLQLEYITEGDRRYVNSVADIDEETFKLAYEKGKECFVNANEYGLRIFTEANLPYTWVGTQDYTFEWSNPRLISSYIETVKDEYRGNVSKRYNYLEIIYEVHIAQANGVGCDAEAVVCFDDLTIDDNGNVDINEDSAQLFSASYLDKNIKDSLKGWFGDEYILEKFDLAQMNLEN